MRDWESYTENNDGMTLVFDTVLLQFVFITTQGHNDFELFETVNL